MEELTKTQLILLALLVSFVTSIATGIATVALMDQAPADVTRVINRVVERTVEKVTPSEQGASVVTTEKTVIVKEEDALTDAIRDISDSLVLLYVTDTSRTFLGMASVVSIDGYLVTDGDAVTLGATYEAVLPGGQTLAAEVIGENKAKGLAVLRLQPGEEGGSVPSVTKIVPTGASMKLGQTVFTVSGEATKVATGIVTGLPEGADGAVTDIEVNIATTDFVTGAPLGNIFGEIVGIARSTSSQRFIPIDEVMEVVRAVRMDVSAEAEGESAEL